MRAISESVRGSTARVRPAMGPTVSALTRVPMPGFWRSGIQSSMIRKLSTRTLRPKSIPVRNENPWERTSHGERPSAARTNRAIATP
ncbi:hypothetical protein D9V32_11555 [Mycetocola tolaasinivorans]|uniref:Uncharacterized protein n=1 Tax=Mycetocola tolaasinivorans TaxID=76635 RepID=A0A3L7A526_9MICO|nr:hypothetical protein D9V32_11555 [Mycetocola tolaasinivorans]